MIRQVIVAVLLVLWLPSLAQAAPNDFSRRADAVMATFPEFSGTVLVAKDGAPVLRKAYGLANREWNIANTPETRFRLGSLTKAFTAVAILQLQEAGKLSVDDPISKYYAGAPEAWRGITLKHLLTHTSGIPSYTALPGFMARDSKADRTPDEIIQLTRDKPLEFEPGSKYAYDNTGYILLGYVVEKVSGEPYARYVTSHIFEPLGMKASGYDTPEAIIPLRAAGYERRGGQVVNAAYLAMTLPYAAGSLYSTVDDMLIWDQALRSARVLKPESLKAMFTDQGFAYGFGWIIDRKFDRPRISHGGGINGFVTKFDRYQDDGLAIVVLANDTSMPVGSVADELAAAYFDRPPRTATAGSEAAVRRVVAELAAGAPDYDRLSPRMAELTRAQLPALRQMLTTLGPLQDLAMVRAEAGGADVYRLRFEKGALEFSVTLGPDGKVVGAGMRPVL
jgi:CubicO group peptidase (beta-lactamase class C family)